MAAGRRAEPSTSTKNAAGSPRTPRAEPSTSIKNATASPRTPRAEPPSTSDKNAAGSPRTPRADPSTTTKNTAASPRTPRPLPDMVSKGSGESSCKVCTKRPISGNALGDQMPFCRNAGKQPKTMLSPPPSEMSNSKEFSTSQSPRDMSMHSNKKVMAKPNEKPAGPMETLANANANHVHNMKKVILAGPKLPSCPNCGKEFESHGALRDHKSHARCHPDVTALKPNDAEGLKNVTGVPLMETRKYYCKSCGKFLETFQKLGNHRGKCKNMVLSGLEKFYCKYCGKDYPNSRSAAGHMGHCSHKKAAHNSSRHVLQDNDD